jgi:hypothetical protein
MPFQKGHSLGNRKGRPKKGSAMADLLRYVGDLKFRDGDTTYRERAALAIWEQAAKGFLPALQFIVERTEGKTPTRLDVSGSLTQEHTGTVEIRAVDYRHSIRALNPPREALEDGAA